MSARQRPSRLLELHFPARAGQLRDVRDAVRRCVQESGAGPACVNDIVMAVDEACQNVVRHAYAGGEEGPVDLTIDRSGDELVFSLRDFASAVDPGQVKPRDLEDVHPGGIGTHLIRSVMDSTEFVKPDDGIGNLFRMVKRIR
jgi:sigma-B regulation protein RsbU (phosphoserine phosphatase)